jgi:decaprenyl-phosphate phosphoribosyltransferase
MSLQTFSAPSRQRLSDYVALARPDHWFKNVFMLPGVALALVLRAEPLSLSLVRDLVIAFVATCLIASANYTINEWLDADFDRHHPVKRLRPSALGHVSMGLVGLQWFLLAAAGVALASVLGILFMRVAALLLCMGIVYNVQPLRTKDRPYLDVLSESINNPLRFMLGWAAVVSTTLPPSSILLAYWMGGAFLMAVKRYAEFRFIGNPTTAALYRRSFRSYTEETLLLSSFFYALTAAFFLGVFLIKYRIEFLLSIPLFALLFVWYLHIGMKADSVTQKPERLYQEPAFLAYVLFLGLVVTALFIIHIPWLSILVTDHVLTGG